MPTDEEVEDYEFRLRIEAEENGEEEDAEGGSDIEDVNEPEEEEAAEVPVQADVPLANRCKVCLDGIANVCTFPCKHMAMCEQFSELLRDDRCPICRTPIATKFTIFLS